MACSLRAQVGRLMCCKCTDKQGLHSSIAFLSEDYRLITLKGKALNNLSTESVYSSGRSAQEALWHELRQGVELPCYWIGCCRRA